MRMSVGLSLLLPLWGMAHILLSVAMAQSHWPSEPSEAVRDWDNQLEASMHSVLSDLHEAVPTVVGIPDGTAVVGRSFRVTIPTDLIASSGDIIKVRLDIEVNEEEFSSSVFSFGAFSSSSLSSTNSELSSSSTPLEEGQPLMFMRGSLYTQNSILIFILVLILRASPCHLYWKFY